MYSTFIILLIKFKDRFLFKSSVKRSLNKVKRYYKLELKLKFKSSTIERKIKIKIKF